MRYWILIVWLFLFLSLNAQKPKLGIQNINGTIKYFNYNFPMVLKFKEGKEANYPFIQFAENSEKVVRFNLVSHSKDSFYFKGKIPIAYQDIEWFYIEDIGSFTNKLFVYQFLTYSAIITANSYGTKYFIYSFPFYLVSILLINKLEKSVYYTTDWFPILNAKTTKVR